MISSKDGLPEGASCQQSLIKFSNSGTQQLFGISGLSPDFTISSILYQNPISFLKFKKCKEKSCFWGGGKARTYLEYRPPCCNFIQKNAIAIHINLFWVFFPSKYFRCTPKERVGFHCANGDKEKALTKQDCRQHGDGSWTRLSQTRNRQYGNWSQDQIYQSNMHKRLEKINDSNIVHTNTFADFKSRWISGGV